MVGAPIHMDKATANAKRLAYAICFIEVSAAKPLPKKISLQIEGGNIFDIEVEYEWIPPVCTKCTSFGHITCQCPTKATWVPIEQTENNAASSNLEFAEGTRKQSQIGDNAVEQVINSLLLE